MSREKTSRAPSGAARLATVIALLWLTAAPALCDNLRVRLVRTSYAELPVSDDLRDIMPALRSSLVFKGYELMAQAGTALPVDGKIIRLGGYAIRFEGPTTRMRIVIQRGAHTIMETVATLREGQPLLLGGFSGGGSGQVVFVFTLD